MEIYSFELFVPKNTSAAACIRTRLVKQAHRSPTGWCEELGIWGVHMYYSTPRVCEQEGGYLVSFASEEPVLNFAQVMEESYTAYMERGNE